MIAPSAHRGVGDVPKSAAVWVCAKSRAATAHKSAQKLTQ